MKHATRQFLGLVFLLSALFIFSGCSSRQPISNYARSGDTVVLSLGGTDGNALVSVLKKQNISVTITDAASNTYTAKVRNVFRVYSDPTSGYDFRSPTANMNYDNYVTPHQGLWLAVIDLVDPGSGAALPLAVGAASISLSSPDLNPWVDYPGWGWTWTNGDLRNIPIEILAGSGSTNPMNYLTPLTTAPLDSLTAGPQVEVTVLGTPSQAVGGGSFVFRVVNAGFGSGSGDQLPRAVTTTPDRNVQLAWSQVNQGDGTSLLKIMITNPHGFNVDNSKTGLPTGNSLLRSLRFSIVWDSKVAGMTITDMNWTSSIQLVSGEYIDVNGNVLPELSPLLTKVN